MRNVYVLGLIALCACEVSFEDDPSRGELGVAEFSWDEGALGCIFGCDASEAMVAGGVANLRVVNAGGLPEFTVESDDPSIAEMTRVGSSTVQIDSLSAGDVKLVLRDALDREVIDRFRIRVRDIEKIGVRDDLYRERFTILAGGESTIYVDLTHDGKRLVGVGAVDYALEGDIGEQQVTLTSAFVDVLLSALAGTIDDYIEIRATAVGSGAISATAQSGATLVIPVDIVDASAVTRIDLDTFDDETVIGESFSVDAYPKVGDEPLFAPRCEWSIDPAEGPIEIGSAGSSFVSLSATGPGTATVTCAMGNATGSLDVTF